MGSELSKEKLAQKQFDFDNLACCGANRQITEAKDDRRGLPAAPMRSGTLHSKEAVLAAHKAQMMQSSSVSPHIHFPSHPAYIGPSQGRAPRVPPNEQPYPSRQVPAPGREVPPLVEANPPNELIKALTELKNAKSAAVRENAPEKVRTWLSQHESARSLPHERPEPSTQQVAGGSMKLRNHVDQGHDDPDIISRPSRAPVGGVGKGQGMGKVGSAAFNMGKVPNATFNMKQPSTGSLGVDRVGSADSRKSPPSDGAWFQDPEAGSDAQASKAETEGYDDPDIISKPAKAPVGRVNSKTKNDGLGRTGYNSLKVAVAHLKDARQHYNNPEKAGLKNPYARASSLNNVKSPPAGFDDPDIISRPVRKPGGSFGGRLRAS